MWYGVYLEGRFQKRQSEIQMTSHHEDLRGIKKRDRFKQSDDMSERDVQFWIKWLQRNEKSHIDEIGRIPDE